MGGNRTVGHLYDELESVEEIKICQFKVKCNAKKCNTAEEP